MMCAMDETIRQTRPEGGTAARAQPELTMRQVQDNLQFGAVAIKLGFCTIDQVDACLRLQQKMKGLGIAPKKIGELLLEKSFLTPAQVDEIVRAQARRAAGNVQVPGYRIQSKIGQGSMGAIYRAVQMSMDRPVAIKVLATKYAESPRFVERFFREARAVAKLNHPNIIQGIDVGDAGGLYYFVMEFVDGPTVGEILRRGGALDEKRSLYIVLQVAKALSHAWKNGLLHRDIKPDNIMITRDGVAKLCDLGLAKNLGPGDDPAGTNPGAAMGTPYYISPEQARGDKQLDVRTDIYSLGASFFHMVVGDVPFPGDNAAVVIAKHLTDAAPSPRARNPLVSKAVDAIILQMMARDRDQRMQTPEDLIRAMEEISTAPGGTPVSTPDVRRETTGRHGPTGTRRRFLIRRRR